MNNAKYIKLKYIEKLIKLNCYYIAKLRIINYKNKRA